MTKCGHGINPVSPNLLTCLEFTSIYQLNKTLCLLFDSGKRDYLFPEFILSFFFFFWGEIFNLSRKIMKRKKALVTSFWLLPNIKTIFISSPRNRFQGTFTQGIWLFIFISISQTRELIEDLKSAGSLERQGTRSKLGADSKTLVRILCHRTDPEASQFLKKQYKIPKSTA